jgi:hairy and enhancer of split, invertebrate
MDSTLEFNNYNLVDEAPMSRTHQYRKVMKPLLERRRRARINKCLDDLKDLMVSALQSEGESITKLEKADVLELTVRHLQKLKRQQMLQANPAIDIDRFRAGYSSCASEVSRFLASVPGVKIHLGTQLMSHLGVRMSAIEQVSASPLSVNCHSTLSRPQMSLSPSSDGGYTSGRESSPSPPLSVGCPSPAPQVSSTTVWRPF